MKRVNAFTQAAALASLFAAISFAHAEEVPISGALVADKITATVVSVDAAKHRLVLKDTEGQEGEIQLTEKAKNLDKLKAGDTVQAVVTRSVVAVLETETDKATSVKEQSGVARATEANPNPGGAAFRQVRVRLKITAIDLEKHQVTLMGPAGKTKTVTVEKPDLQERMKNLKVDQTVAVTYTDTLEITTEH
ncbi:hypothetical protein ACVW0Y_001155 [Pseudomonas sp. TE3786]